RHRGTGGRARQGARAGLGTRRPGAGDGPAVGGRTAARLQRPHDCVDQRVDPRRTDDDGRGPRALPASAARDGASTERRPPSTLRSTTEPTRPNRHDRTDTTEPGEGAIPMRAVRYHGNRDVRVDDITEPECRPGFVKIAPEWCGICGR